MNRGRVTVPLVPLFHPVPPSVPPCSTNYIYLIYIWVLFFCSTHFIFMAH